HGGLQSFLRHTGAHPFGWPVVSDFLLQRTAALDVLRERAPERYQRNGRERTRDHQGLFPETAAAPGRGCLRIGGSRDRVCRVSRNAAVLRDRSRRSDLAAAVFPGSSRVDCAGGGVVALSAQRGL